jgi:catechol 2,3-dioxygenase-like lactoylglutathione lyase family enzyme
MPLADAPLTASLPAHDIDRAKRWYDEKLGLTPIMDLGPAGQLYRSGGSLWIIYQTPSAGTGKHTLAAFIVPDLDAAMRELRAKGVTFQEYAMGDEGPTTENGVARDDNGGAVAWFIDSEDNILALTQMPPGMTLPGASG